MKIFLAGASGTIGRALVPHLLRAGHRVVAMTRQVDRAASLTRLGAAGVVGDVFDRDRLKRLIGEAEPDAVIHQLTSIPERINPREAADQLAATNRLRIEGTRNLIEAAAGARWFVAQSIAFAYAPRTTVATETSLLHDDAPRSFAPIIQAVRSLESQVLQRRGGTVLRYGFFYGPGTVYAPGGSFHDDVLRRNMPIPAPGSGVWSFIHVEDAAAATRMAIGRPGVYNIVDDDPAPLHEWMPAYAAAIGARAPRTVPGFLTRLAAGAYGVYLLQEQPGASNARARRELGWTPSLPSWRDGFRHLLPPALSA